MDEQHSYVLGDVLLIKRYYVKVVAIYPKGIFLVYQYRSDECPNVLASEWSNQQFFWSFEELADQKARHLTDIEKALYG